MHCDGGITECELGMMNEIQMQDNLSIWIKINCEIGQICLNEMEFSYANTELRIVIRQIWLNGMDNLWRNMKLRHVIVRYVWMEWRTREEIRRWDMWLDMTEWNRQPVHNHGAAWLGRFANNQGPLFIIKRRNRNKLGNHSAFTLTNHPTSPSNTASTVWLKDLWFKVVISLTAMVRVVLAFTVQRLTMNRFVYVTTMRACWAWQTVDRTRMDVNSSSRPIERLI